VTGLVNGVGALRLAGDAVVDLWRRDHDPVAGAATSELRAITVGVVGWYEVLAAALDGRARVPAPLGPDTTRAERLVHAVVGDGDGGRAMRIIWTGDHLDAARRLQELVSGPARSLRGGR
jgi:hypothetical protein